MNFTSRGSLSPAQRRYTQAGRAAKQARRRPRGAPADAALVASSLLFLWKVHARRGSVPCRAEPSHVHLLCSSSLFPPSLANSSAAARFLRPSFALPAAKLRFRPWFRTVSAAMEQASGSGPPPPPPPAAERDMGFAERSLAAAGAAVVSAILVNPLDVAKTRLQAQAAGVVYNPIWSDFRCYPSCSTGGINGFGPSCSPECFQYRGTMDVFSKVTRQEGLFRLWRGTGASLALAVPTVGIYLPSYDLLRNWIEEYSDHNFAQLRPYASILGSIARSLACITCSPIELARTRMQAFKESNVGGKPPGMWKTLLGVLSSRQSISSPENFRGYHLLWTGLGAQLARDVPFSAICWTVLEPTRRHLTGLVGDKSNAAVISGANFSAGFIAGVISAGATCPLDVAKTRRQIEKDPERILNMNTRRILLEVWRKEGVSGLFRGAGPRMGRAGPSVGIVVSSYEVVKHILHRKHAEL